MKRFSTFSLDTANQCIWLKSQRVPLQPKAFAVLAYLTENPARIVTKEELLETVWPDIFVQEAVLKTCILALRKALDDDPKNPKCIETVHRRGYRFIDTPAGATNEESSDTFPAATAPTTLLGRESDLKKLHTALGKAQKGERQVVFVTGEPGIGKSTLISHFLEAAARTFPIRCLRGQCIEHFGAREAYYPVFDALSRAAQESWMPDFLAILRTHAPTWLVELPAVASTPDRESLKQETLGATRDRMLREMTEAIEALAAETPVVVVLEDLHWSDVSTLDLISSVASRQAGARLIVIASYRPVEVALADHPVKSVKQGLRARGLCTELPLELLSQKDVSSFLEARFSPHRFPPEFARLVHERTEGNPLYVTNVLDYAVSRSVILQRDGVWEASSAPGDFDLHAPESLTQMIERQIERLSPEEQSALEVASVIGLTFAVPLMPGIGVPEEESLEACCDSLAKRHLFVRTVGISEIPGGQIGARYQFLHALYRDVFYKRLPPARRVRLHHTVGEWLESLYQARLSEVASELALHFQECHDFERTIRYLLVVAQRSASRHALREALEALTRGITIAERLPAPVRLAAELALSEEIGLVYRLMGQLTSSAAEFNKMYEQARQASSVEGQLRALLWYASVSSWLDRADCLKAIEKIKELCKGQISPDLRVNAQGQVAYFNLLFHGWAQEDYSASALALEAARNSSNRAALALECNRHSFFQSLASQYRDACSTAKEGVRIATEIESLMDYSVGHFFEAFALFHSGDWGSMRRLLRSSSDMANRNGHDFWVLLFGLLEAMLHLETFSFEQAHRDCREYLTRARQLGHALSIQICLVLLGKAQLGIGDLDSAQQTFDEIIRWQDDERILMDWIWRLPLQFSYVELCLARKDVQAAIHAADLFLSQTARTAEKTWTGLAHLARAKVAELQKDDRGARLEIAEGLRIIEECEAPLAAWRLHAFAARTLGANKHLVIARNIVQGLANSLTEEQDLQRCFLSAPDVAALVGSGLKATV